LAARVTSTISFIAIAGQALLLGSIVEVAIRYDVPSAIPRPDETENCSGEGGIAENAGMINRIDSVQAARLHKPAALARVVAAGRPSSGRDAENS
jgi:hypothetical protein